MNHTLLLVAVLATSTPPLDPNEQRRFDTWKACKSLIDALDEGTVKHFNVRAITKDGLPFSCHSDAEPFDELYDNATRQVQERKKNRE